MRAPSIRMALRRLLRAMLAGACLPLLAATDADDRSRDAREFLLRYAGLTTAADPAAIDLYRDDARIRLAAVAGDREVSSAVVDGAEWKRQLRARRSGMEASSFVRPTTGPEGRRLRIQAQRYSHTRCYWDRAYAVTIEPDATGRYFIVDERLTVRRDAACAAATPTTPLASPAAQATAWPNASAAPPGARALPPNVAPSGHALPRVPAPTTSR